MFVNQVFSKVVDTDTQGDDGATQGVEWVAKESTWGKEMASGRKELGGGNVRGKKAGVKSGEAVAGVLWCMRRSMF